MRKVGYFLLLAFMFMLLAFKPGWAAQESAAEEKAEAAAGIVDEGRGEGFREEAETEKKGVECPATFGPIITDTAVPIEKGKFAIQPTFAYSFVTSALTQNWRRVSACGDFQSFNNQWKLTYGLWDNLETFVVIPYVHNWARNVNACGPNGETSADSGGLGDVNWTLKYRLVEETEKLPTVSAVLNTAYPTGRFKGLNPGNLGQDILGSGAYVFTTGFNLSKCYNPFVVYANFWYSMQTAYSNDDGRQYPRDFVTINLAAEYAITTKWIGLLELTSYWDGGRLFGHKANVSPGALLSVIPGIEYMATDKFALALGCQVDLIGKNNNTNVTPLFSVVYSF
jgi:hypothetical protein